MRTLLLLCVFALLSTTARAQVLLEENFPYAAGTALTASGNWAAHSGGGTNPVTVTANNLTLARYPSVSGNAVELKGGAGTREDVNRGFTSPTTGDIFASFLVRVDSASATEDYFFHFLDTPTSTGFRARVFTRDQGTGFQFGISKSSVSATAPVTYDPTIRTFGTTYLLVVRYSIVAGPTNDTVTLYVQTGTASGTLPTNASAVAADVSASDLTPAFVALRQGSQNYGMTVDGIRVGQVFGFVTTAVEPGTASGLAHFSLVGAQPSPAVRVRLTTEVPGAVRVAAYDALGRLVATLLDGDMAGAESRELTLSGVPAGVYVIRATGMGFAASRTVVVH